MALARDCVDLPLSERYHPHYGIRSCERRGCCCWTIGTQGLAPPVWLSLGRVYCPERVGSRVASDAAQGMGVIYHSILTY